MALLFRVSFIFAIIALFVLFDIYAIALSVCSLLFPDIAF